MVGSCLLAYCVHRLFPHQINYNSLVCHLKLGQLRHRIQLLGEDQFIALLRMKIPTLLRKLTKSSREWGLLVCSVRKKTAVAHCATAVFLFLFFLVSSCSFFTICVNKPQLLTVSFLPLRIVLQRTEITLDKESRQNEHLMLKSCV